MANRSDLRNYLDNINSVKGWCNPELWNCIEPILDLQDEKNIQGPIAEIGVFHGKFFIGLALSKGKDLKHCAMDVFDMQEFNVDKAGVGNKEVFERNLTKNGVQNTEIFQVDSMAMESDFIEERKNTYSLFSVDACHMVEHTINDFRIAMKMIRKDGIIFIDDYNNPNWPGVQEGVTKFYLNNICNFIPLLYTCNKLFVCNISYHKMYMDYIEAFLKANYPDSRVKHVKRFGYDTLTVGPDWNLKKYLV